MPIGILLFLLIYMASLNPSWSDTGAKRAVVLVIDLAQSDLERSDEAALMDSLKLNLDNFTVQKVRVNSPRFAELSVNRQLEHIKAALARYNGFGAVWLTSLGGELALQLVVLDTGRTVVRVFEEQRTDRAASKLGRTVSEILESAYLLEIQKADPGLLETPPGQTQEDRDMQMDRDNGAPDLLSFFVSGVGEGGILASFGPSIAVGGALGLILNASDAFGFKVGLGSSFGPMGEMADLELRGWSVWGEMGLLLRFPIASAVTLGPFVGIRGGMRTLGIKERGYARKEYRSARWAGDLGLHLGIPLGEPVVLGVSLGLTATPNVAEITRLSTGEKIVKTAAMGWVFSIELYVF